VPYSSQHGGGSYLPFVSRVARAGLALLNFGIDEFGHNRPVKRRHRRASNRALRTRPDDLPRQLGDTVLDVKNLSVVYDTGSEALRAVNDVSLGLGVGTTVGIAGESGSGKSTLAHAIATLTRPPAEIVSGSVEYFPSVQTASRQGRRCREAGRGGTSQVSLGRDSRRLPERVERA